jgi:hypothetical protein
MRVGMQDGSTVRTHAAPQLKEVQTASARAKLQPIIANASKEDDFAPALQLLVQQGAEALLVGADPSLKAAASTS